ncbi:MAG: DUF4493 domain-containing protein [Alistipes sp.]|nr:DUF4493 domain-containing protein [Alistipes sp.]
MKQYLKSLLLVAVAACAAACSMDKLSTTPEGGDAEKGYLQIGGVVVNADTENTEIGGGGRAVSEADGNYYLEVIDKTTGGAVWSGTYASLRENGAVKNIGLEPGTYVVYAYQSADKRPAAGVAADAPYYAGHSEDVTIITKQTQSVSVTCRLANILTTVELSADLKAVFKPYDSTSEMRLMTNVEVGTASLKNEYTFEAASTHTSPLVYFRDEAGVNNSAGNTMSIVLSGDYYTGDPVDAIEGRPDETLWKHVKMAKTITNVRAAQWRKISIDIDHNTTGTAQFTFTIESYLYDDEITVDVVTLYADLTIEEAIPDDDVDDPAAPSVTINGQTDLNYQINGSMFDETQNIWTKWLSLNIAPNDGTSVQEIYAVFASTNTTLLPAMEAKGFTEGRVALFPTNAATDYATVSADGKTVTLLQNGMSTLYKYAGTHTVSVYTVDSENRKKHTDIIITVTGGAVVGPTITWTANGVPASTLLIESGSETADATVTSSTGLTGLSVKIISDVLTPEELGNFNLAPEMDLFNPATAIMETRLRAFGFLPIDTEAFDPSLAKEAMAAGDDKYRLFDPATGLRKDGVESPLKGSQEVKFSVTEFLSLLAALDNVDNTQYKSTNLFELTASDESGTNTAPMTINVKR